MPIAQIHLVRGAFPTDAIGAALVEATGFYARTLYPDAEVAPIERVRFFVHQMDPEMWCAGGRLAGEHFPAGRSGPPGATSPSGAG